jgi:Fic family protein
MKRGVSREAPLGRRVLQPQGYFTFLPLHVADLQDFGALRLTSHTMRLVNDCDALLVRLCARHDTESARSVPSATSTSTDARTSALLVGLADVSTAPPTVDLLCRLHAMLFALRAGGPGDAGQIRATQNWLLGARDIVGKRYPPPPQALAPLLRDLDLFLRTNPLSPCAYALIAYAQFELIHPFRDGNGRVGRLLFALSIASRLGVHSRHLRLDECLWRHRAQTAQQLLRLHFVATWDDWITFGAGMMMRWLREDPSDKEMG